VSHDKTVHALVPDRLGITVVDVDALVGYLEEGQSLEDAIQNAGIDQVGSDELERVMGLVRDLNESEDGSAYWSAR